MLPFYFGLKVIQLMCGDLHMENEVDTVQSFMGKPVKQATASFGHVVALIKDPFKYVTWTEKNVLLVIVIYDAAHKTKEVISICAQKYVCLVTSQKSKDFPKAYKCNIHGCCFKKLHLILQ